jgi:hypothetical protein
MKKFYLKDYANIIIFLVVVSMVLISYVNSDYFTGFSMTGFAIKQVGNMHYNVDYLSLGNDVPAVNDEIIIYASIIDANAPFENASCSVTIGNNIQKMSYNKNLGQYEFTTAFASEGNYSYIVNCNIETKNKESGETESYSFKEDGKIEIQKIEIQEIEILEAGGGGGGGSGIPDFNASITYGQAVKDQQTSINVTITNSVPGTYSGQMLMSINFGDSVSVTSQNFMMNSAVAIVQFNHTYANTGEFNITAIVDPSSTITESNENNNIAIKAVNVSSSGTAVSVCGNLSESVTLSSNLYCEGGIVIKQSGVVLDCNNYRIYGDTSTNGVIGVYSDVIFTMQNCSIDKYWAGVNTRATATIKNSTFKDNNIGVILNSSSNSLTLNVFTNNNIAIYNLKESTIQSNDFRTNTLNLNTTVTTEFSNNYFGSDSDSTIVNKIISNAAVVNYKPTLNFSSRGNDSSNSSGPNVTVAGSKTKTDTEVSFFINATTNITATCRISDSSDNYDVMEGMKTINMRNHTYETTYPIDFEDELVFNIICKDDNGIESSLVTYDAITSATKISDMIDELDDEIKEYQDTKKYYQQKNSELDQRRIEETDENKIKLFTQQIALTNLDIIYVDKVINNCNGLKTTLTDLKTKISNLDTSFLKPYKDKIGDFVNNLSRFEGNISISFEESIVSLPNNLSGKSRNMENLYLYKQKNETKTKEKNDLTNDYLVAKLEKEKKDLEAELEKYINMSRVSGKNYDSQIANINNSISKKKEDIIKKNESEVRDDFDIEIIELENRIDLTDSYIDDLEILSDQIDDGYIALQDAGEDNEAEKIDLLKEEVEISIDSANDELKSLREQLKSKQKEYRDYRYSSNNPVVAVDGLTRIKWNPEHEKGVVTIIFNQSQKYLRKIVARFEGNDSKDSYIDLYNINENPIWDPEKSATFAWFNITESADIKVTGYDITFEMNDTFLNASNSDRQSVRLFLRDNEWKPQETSSIVVKTTTFTERLTPEEVGGGTLPNNPTPNNVTPVYNNPNTGGTPQNPNQQNLTPQNPNPQTNGTPQNNGSRPNQPGGGDRPNNSGNTSPIQGGQGPNRQNSGEGMTGYAIDDLIIEQNGTGNNSQPRTTTPTTITKTVNAYWFTSTINNSGYFALGSLEKVTGPIINNTPACVPDIECTNFTECNSSGRMNRTCQDKNNCDGTGTAIVEEGDCTPPANETCFNKRMDYGESGIDCGGPCAACIKIEQPGIIEDEEDSKYWWITPTILLALIAIGVGGILHRRKKKAPIMILKTPTEKPRGEPDVDKPAEEAEVLTKKGKFNYKLMSVIIKKLFEYDELTNIKKYLIQLQYSEDEANYYIQLVGFIFDKIEKSTPTSKIMEGFLKQAWVAEDAREVVDYVCEMYMWYYLKEYFLETEYNDEEKKILVDMFSTQGLAIESINKAFEAYEKKKKPKLAAPVNNSKL